MSRCKSLELTSFGVQFLYTTTQSTNPYITFLIFVYSKYIIIDERIRVTFFMLVASKAFTIVTIQATSECTNPQFSIACSL